MKEITLSPTASEQEMIAFAQAWSEEEFAIRKLRAENRKRLFGLRDWLLTHTVDPGEIPLKEGDMYWYRCRTKPTAKKVVTFALQTGMDTAETAQVVKSMIAPTTPALGLRKSRRRAGR